MAKKKRVQKQATAAVVRTDGGERIEVPAGRAFEEMAVRWSYLIRNRAIWEQREKDAICTKLLDDMQRLGYQSADLQKLARAGYIEVDVEFTEEKENWAARIFPWEFVLTTAAAAVGATRAPIVARRLVVKDKKIGKPGKAPNSLAFISAAPGALEGIYSFHHEQALVMNSLAPWIAMGKSFTLTNPSLSQLAKFLKNNKPQLIHLSGIDLHQGADLLRRADVRFRDGLYLADEKHPNSEVEVEANRLARALAGEDHQTRLVGLNLHNSAPRIAPLTIAAGAQAVVAFQDVVEDSIAELFFAEFYRNFALTPENLGVAFERTLRAIMQSGISLSGAGIVLWIRDSLLTKRKAEEAEPQTFQQVFTVADLAMLPLDKAIRVDISSAQRIDLNYSSLHNGQALFQRLSILNGTGKTIDKLNVRVQMFLAQGTYDCTTTVSVDGPGKDLRPLLPLPLVGSHFQSFRESVLTNLKIAVEWEGRVVFDQNLRLRILPMNEWRDTDDERQWLPSFVQSTDPAVQRVLSFAERHLRSIQDDPFAGFDGYQQVDEDDESTLEVVDQQVRAIWAALIYDCRLTYVNPPPTFSKRSQRIRSPKEVLATKRGTCIDLSILLASILEYVEIYPVVILLQGHAFPAYWRSEGLREAFIGTVEDASDESMWGAIEARGESSGKLDDRSRRFPWMVKVSGYARVVEAVRAGALVPLESVWLTSSKSFDDAIEVGGENLNIKREFECLLDIAKAREKGVLPLPERAK